MSVICQALEDCWDVDSDARLSAECLIMRLKSLTENDVRQNSDKSGIIADDVRIDLESTSEGRSVTEDGNSHSHSTQSSTVQFESSTEGKHW